MHKETMSSNLFILTIDYLMQGQKYFHLAICQHYANVALLADTLTIKQQVLDLKHEIQNHFHPAFCEENDNVTYQKAAIY